jgi:hypothetical protein
MHRAEGRRTALAISVGLKPTLIARYKLKILVWGFNPDFLRSWLQSRNQNSLIPSASCPGAFLAKKMTINRNSNKGIFIIKLSCNP